MSPVEIPRPTDDDKAVFQSLVPDRPDVTVRPMFGNLGAYVNGNMFMGLFGSSIGLKLAEADREQLLAVTGSGPFGPAERPMSGYVSIPASWRAPSTDTDDWITRSLDHVASLPPKAKKPKKT